MKLTKAICVNVHTCEMKLQQQKSLLSAKKPLIENKLILFRSVLFLTHLCPSQHSNQSTKTTKFINVRHHKFNRPIIMLPFDWLCLESFVAVKPITDHEILHIQLIKTTLTAIQWRHINQTARTQTIRSFALYYHQSSAD